MSNYDQAMNALLKLQGLPHEEPPVDEAVIQFRMKAIAAYYAGHDIAGAEKYLAGLGFVRGSVIKGREVLRQHGKKAYEAFMRESLSELAAAFSTINERHYEYLRDLLNVPFRRSAAKDEQELKLTLWVTSDEIIKHRRGDNWERIREYAQTVANNIGDEHVPPQLAAMIIKEVQSLVDIATKAGVHAYQDTGLTCEEFVEFDEPEREEKPRLAAYSPPMDWPVEGIAEQSLWWGLDEELDYFILSLSSGLLHCASV